MENTDALWNLANDLLTLAGDCFDISPNGGLTNRYVDVTEPTIACCDAIVVWLRDYRPVQPGQFPEENFQPIETCGNIDYMPVLVVSVARGCAPTIQRSRSDPLPDSKAINDFSKIIFSDIMTLQCCVWEQLANGYLLDGINYSDGSHWKMIPKNIEVYQMPGCVRIDLPIAFDFSGCC